MNFEKLMDSRLFRSLLSVGIGLILAALLIQLSGFNAGEAFSTAWIGGTGLQSGPPSSPTDFALGSGHVSLFQLAQSLARVTPLLLCGLAVAIGLRAGLFNIGGQGQMTVGALASAAVGMSPIPDAFGLHLALMILSGGLAGAVWGAIPGILKAWRGVHEVISTIMMNFIGMNLVAYLVSHNLKDAYSQNLQTAQITKGAWLSPLVAHSNLTAGLALAIILALAMSFFLARTALGFQIRAVGLGAEAAKTAGISVPKTLVLTMALSGALAGVAGAVEVAGVHHRYVDGVAGNFGFDGIAVALLGGLGGGGSILSAFFFGFLSTGSDYMQSLTGVPAPIAVVVQAVVILFVGVKVLRTKKMKMKMKKEALPESASKDDTQ